ncbi:MAG TPA: hypothetical protein VNC50_15275 [Planctomycetia bacterium]|nr:hypothetical protein [Planctomycetia bacterium]
MAKKRKSSGGGRSWLVTRLMRWLGFGSPTVLVMGILGYFGIRAPDLSSFEREPQSAAEVAERWKKVRELWASLNGSAATSRSRNCGPSVPATRRRSRASCAKRG